MADPDTGMSKGDMKRLLILAKEQPIHCAAAVAKEPGVALLVFDKVKAGRALEAVMKKDHPELKMTGFGTVHIDPAEDEQLAKFTLNKAGSGLARRLVKTLRGTGVKRVTINDEEGQLLDSCLGEEEGGENEAGETRKGRPRRRRAKRHSPTRARWRAIWPRWRAASPKPRRASQTCRSSLWRWPSRRRPG